VSVKKYLWWDTVIRVQGELSDPSSIKLAHRVPQMIVRPSVMRKDWWPAGSAYSVTAPVVTRPACARWTRLPRYCRPARPSARAVTAIALGSANSVTAPPPTLTRFTSSACDADPRRPGVSTHSAIPYKLSRIIQRATRAEDMRLEHVLPAKTRPPRPAPGNGEWSDAFVHFICRDKITRHREAADDKPGLPARTPCALIFARHYQASAEPSDNCLDLHRTPPLAAPNSAGRRPKLSDGGSCHLG